MEFESKGGMTLTEARRTNADPELSASARTIELTSPVLSHRQQNKANLSDGCQSKVLGQKLISRS